MCQAIDEKCMIIDRNPQIIYVPIALVGMPDLHTYCFPIGYLANMINLYTYYEYTIIVLLCVYR